MKKKKILIIIFVIVAISILVLQFLMRPYAVIDDISMTILSVIPSVISFYLFSTFNKEKDSDETYQIYENIRGSVRMTNSLYTSGKETDDGEGVSDILELMLANMKEIKDYYVLSKMQAKNSFFLAVVMCITGFLLMGISISATFLNAENLMATIVPAIGAALVEIIAGTSLVVYKKSLEQLNHYYDSLHNNERFLSIVNIVSKVSLEKRDEMYSEIIRSQVGIISQNVIIQDKG